MTWVGLVGTSSAADLAGPQWREFPFAQRLDMAFINGALRTPPSQLVQVIDRAGVQVLVVPSPAPSGPINPLLAGLPVAPASLVSQADFRDSYEGKIVFRDATCCRLPRDTLLVRDTARNYTLLHEFVQSQLVNVDGRRATDDLELRFATDFRRLVTYQRRLDYDATRLLDPLWRRDILVAQAAVAQRLFARIQMGQSQEAIVEKLLCCEIDERSPYFDAARRAEGLRYGERMIDNAIDLYNTLLASVAFVEGNVPALRDEIRAGRLSLRSRQNLPDDDVDAMLSATKAIRDQIEPVRVELLALKRFYRQ